MTKEQKREIRTLLLGRTQLIEDGRAAALRPGDHRMINGVGDGAGAVRLLGIGRRTQLLSTKLPESRVLEQGRGIMRDIGRQVFLWEQPEVPCCLIRYILTRPVVLTLQYLEGKPVLTAWAGRGATGWISRRRAISAFLKRMPQQIKALPDKAPEDPLEEQPEKKPEKKPGEKAGKEKKNRKNSAKAQGGTNDATEH